MASPSPALVVVEAESGPKESQLVASISEHASELKLEQTDVTAGPRFAPVPSTVTPPPPGTSIVTANPLPPPRPEVQTS
jgi:hypothetical protein